MCSNLGEVDWDVDAFGNKIQSQTSASEEDQDTVVPPDEDQDKVVPPDDDLDSLVPIAVEKTDAAQDKLGRTDVEMTDPAKFVQQDDMKGESRLTVRPEAEVLPEASLGTQAEFTQEDAPKPCSAPPQTPASQVHKPAPTSTPEKVTSPSSSSPSLQDTGTPPGDNDPDSEDEDNVSDDPSSDEAMETQTQRNPFFKHRPKLFYKTQGGWAIVWLFGVFVFGKKAALLGHYSCWPLIVCLAWIFVCRKLGSWANLAKKPG